MEKRDFLKMCAVGALTAPVAALAACKDETGARPQAETSFDRITHTKTIRASYINYAPAVVVDPATNEKSGIFIDLMMLMGQQLGMKVEWGEEIGFGEIAQGLKANRYDICAAGIWPTPARALTSNFTMPSYFSAGRAFVRSDEKTIKSYDDINQPHVRIAVEDGDGVTDVAKAHFPRAQIISFPQIGASAQRLMNVAQNKADVTFDDSYFAQMFIDKNPGKVKSLEGKPLQVFANIMMFDNDDWRTKLMFDTAMEALHNSGEVDRLVEKHTGRSDTFLPLARPYGLLA